MQKVVLLQLLCVSICFILFENCLRVFKWENQHLLVELYVQFSPAPSTW